MSWTQLFKVRSFEAALKPTRKIFHVDPILTGRSLAKVKSVFKMVDIPFVWDEKEVLRENNKNSPYHKFPKGINKRERAYYERLQKLRNGIESAKEKELKFRQESLNKRPYKGLEKVMKMTMPFMIKQSSLKGDNEFGGKMRSRKMVAEFVKEVPRVKNISFGRRKQEKMKNLLEDKVIDVGSIQEAAKRKPKESQTEDKGEAKLKAAGTTATTQKPSKEEISNKILDQIGGSSSGSDDE